MPRARNNRSIYAKLIGEQLTKLERQDVSWVHVEALMRVQHRTLDGLDPQQFAECVLAATMACDVMSREELDGVASSYGFAPPGADHGLRLVPDGGGDAR